MNKLARHSSVVLYLMVAVSSVAQNSPSGRGPKLFIDPQHPEYRISWQAGLPRQDGGMIFPVYELQSSTNLTEWQPVGEHKQGKTGKTDEWLTTVIPAASSPVFYRVRTLFEEQKAKASSLGGAEVFGYEPVFATELARIGQN